MNLFLCANWYGRQKAHDFALVSYMGAGDRADLRNDAVTKVLLESQLGAERAGLVLERASKSSESFSQHYIGNVEIPSPGRPINQHLQKQLIQPVRRLEAIAPEISQWSINQSQFYANLQFLGQATQMRPAVDQLVEEARRTPPTRAQQLHLAILEGDQTNISAALESLQKSDRKMKQTANAQAQGALALGQWQQATEAFADGAQQASTQESQFEHAHYATLYAHICNQLGGSTQPTDLEAEFTPLDSFV